MLIKFICFTILTLYFLVMAVSVTDGPLVSFQSFILGIVGLITIILLTSSLAKTFNLTDSAEIKDKTTYNIGKTHKGSIPLVGGIAVYISIVYGSFVIDVEPFYRVLTISIIPIIVVGLIDDIRGLTIPFRLISQILASWIVITSTDVYLRDLGNLFGYGSVDLNAFGIPFTIFAVVGICNAFNMFDGKDGVIGSVSITIIGALLFLLSLESMTYDYQSIVIISLFVFLAFNLSMFGSKWRIFMGDHGSVALGHLIAWNLVFLSQDQGLITPASAIWLVFFPLTDAILTFIRRIRFSNTIFQADRRHLHTILTDKGISDIKILIVIFCISLLAAFAAIVFNLLSLPEYFILYGYLTILVCLIMLGREDYSLYL